MFRRLVTLTAAFVAAQQAFVLLYLASKDVSRTLTEQRNEGVPGTSLEQVTTHDTYTVTHHIEDGIERITYRPHAPRFKTPVVMQHGMWHGAWCWERWQRLLAEQGWVSHAHSLPGHALSPVQRPIWLCTLDYYLSFLKREMARAERDSGQKPILMGHSMGGALTQWYLKYVGDDLPAAVLVGPWVSHSTFADAPIAAIKRDPLGMVVLTSLQWTATAWVRSPQHAAAKLISVNADITPEALHARLGPESALVLYQHNPPFWSPPRPVRTPLMLVAGGLDAVCLEPALRRAATFYGAAYVVDPRSGHNLMMDGDYRATAARIHDWLAPRATRA